MESIRQIIVVQLSVKYLHLHKLVNIHTPGFHELELDKLLKIQNLVAVVVIGAVAAVAVAVAAAVDSRLCQSYNQEHSFEFFLGLLSTEDGTLKHRSRRLHADYKLFHHNLEKDIDHELQLRSLFSIVANGAMYNPKSDPFHVILVFGHLLESASGIGQTFACELLVSWAG